MANMSLAKRVIRVRVSKIIANDYAARGIAGLLLPGNAFSEEKNTGAKHYLISAQAAEEIHDDALERLSEIDSRKELRGLKIAYVALHRQMAYWFNYPDRRSPGYSPGSLDSPESLEESMQQVGKLFARLRIPVASHKGL